MRHQLEVQGLRKEMEALRAEAEEKGAQLEACEQVSFYRMMLWLTTCEKTGFRNYWKAAVVSSIALLRIFNLAILPAVSRYLQQLYWVPANQCAFTRET